MPSREPVLVIKNNHLGKEMLRYNGVILNRNDSGILLEAIFDRNDLDLKYTVFRRGDRFVEWFYSDRWYNVFEIHDADDDHVKGWYCNFTRPAKFVDGRIEADDLALDLWVYPDGRMLVLDQDEFDALAIGNEERSAVLAGLEELKILLPRHPTSNNTDETL
jgi:hypothetical protein